MDKRQGRHYEPRHIVTYHAPERAQLRNAEEFNDRGVELHIFFHEFDGSVFHLFHLVRDGHKLAGEHLRALGGDYLSHDERLDHLAQQEELIPVSYTHLDVYKRQAIHHTLSAG